MVRSLTLLHIPTSEQFLPSGTGAYKLGANYAPGVMPQKAAIKQGYTQNLWLHGPEHYLTEVGHITRDLVISP